MKAYEALAKQAGGGCCYAEKIGGFYVPAYLSGGKAMENNMAFSRETLWIIAAVALLIAGVVLTLCLTGCAAKPRVTEYRVDYCGAKDFYDGAKDAYPAGEEVTLYYTLIATDTDYSFTLDGEPVNYKYAEQKGFVITFTMPEHDVKLECTERNSMEYIPEE